MKTLYEGILGDIDTAIDNSDKVIKERELLKYYFEFSTTYASPHQLYVIDQQAVTRAAKNMTASIDGQYKYMDGALRGLVTWLENINIYDLGLDAKSIYKTSAAKVLEDKLKRKIQTFFKVKLKRMHFTISKSAVGTINLWFTWEFLEPLNVKPDGSCELISSSILFKEPHK